MPLPELTLGNPDYADMICELSDANARFLLVGGYAVAGHGNPRSTKDIDFWVEPTPENSRRVYAALAAFGAPMSELSPDDFAELDVVFQIGVAPCRIDIITQILPLTFEEAWENRVVVEIDGVEVPMIGLADLIANKRAAGRPQDLADADWLERYGGSKNTA